MDKPSIYFIPWTQSPSYETAPERYLEYEPGQDMVWLCEEWHNATGKVRLAVCGREQLAFFLDKIATFNRGD